MLRSLLITFILTSVMVACQRPFFAGSRPIGYPETPNRTTTDSLADRFGDGTTEKLPIEANGDRDLVDRLSKLPLDKQPFWFINWQALEEHRKNPQTYPQRPNVFIDPLAQPAEVQQLNNNQGFSNTNQGFLNSNQAVLTNNQGLSNSNSNNQELVNANNGLSNPINKNQGSLNNEVYPNQGFSVTNNSFSNSAQVLPDNNNVNSNNGFSNTGTGLTNSINGFFLPNLGNANNEVLINNSEFISLNNGNLTKNSTLFIPYTGNDNQHSVVVNSSQGFSAISTGFTNPPRINITPGLANLNTNSQLASPNSKFTVASINKRFGDIPTITNSKPSITYSSNNSYHHAAFFNRSYNYKTPTVYYTNDHRRN